ncbi:MAG: DUF4363 family protein [Oscillospiraceae bacterium]
MNRLITSIVILAAMAAGCFYSVYLTGSITRSMSNCIDRIEQAFTDDEDQKAVEYAGELHDQWDRVLHYSILINDLGHAMEITSCIAEISSFAEAGDEELYAACDRAQAQLELFREMQTPTLWKIL